MTKENSLDPDYLDRCPFLKNTKPSLLKAPNLF